MPLPRMSDHPFFDKYKRFNGQPVPDRPVPVMNKRDYTQPKPRRRPSFTWTPTERFPTYESWKEYKKSREIVSVPPPSDTEYWMNHW